MTDSVPVKGNSVDSGPQLSGRNFRKSSNIIWRFRGEGVCFNCLSTVIWGEGIWPNRSIIFIVAVDSELPSTKPEYFMTFFKILPKHKSI